VLSFHVDVSRVIVPLCVCRENMPSHFKVKEYCPLVFRNIRERFNVYDDDFAVSIFSSGSGCRYGILEKPQRPNDS